MNDNDIFENLLKLSNKELLQLYAKVIMALEIRNVARTQNSPLGDYTEWLISKAYNLKLEKKSKIGYDAISKEGKRIQIKSRRIISNSDPKQLSAIRNLDKNEFDILIAIVYNKNCDIVEALSIPHEIIKEYATFSRHVNSSILTVTDKLINDKRVKNIKQEIIQKEVEVNKQNVKNV